MSEPIIDPRIKRLDLEHNPEQVVLKSPEEWITYEVFHQRKRGEHHEHVGIVHAPDTEMALIFAKEQYGRRLRCANLWVVRSSDIYSFSYEDEDMFENNIEKNYRDASGFKVRDKINQFKKEEKQNNGSGKGTDI
jgi:ring-1,2-phenylacetyl-CoA epoxidase subunit PaaB